MINPSSSTVFLVCSFITLVGASALSFVIHSSSPITSTLTGRRDLHRRVRHSSAFILQSRTQYLQRATISTATMMKARTNDCGTSATAETMSPMSSAMSDNNSNNNNSSNIPVGSRRERKRSKKNAALLRWKSRIEKRRAILGEGKEHKWLGGAVDPITGKIYGIPSHAEEIICIEPPPPPSVPSSVHCALSSLQVDDERVEVAEGEETAADATTTNTVRISTIPLPPKAYIHGPFKWLRGLVYNDCLYGIPSWHTGGVLKVNLKNVDTAPVDDDDGIMKKREVVSILPLPHDSSYYESCGADSIMEGDRVRSVENKESMQDDGDEVVNRARWMWHGGAIGNGGDSASNSSPPPAIYCPPSNAEHVLKVYLDGTDRVEEIGPKFVQGQNKWYGGILGVDGCIYAPPYTATGVLRIDPKTDSVQVLGNFPYGGYKWHGGLLAKSTGVIYAFPAHSNEVLCIDTNVDRRYRIDEKKENDDDRDGARVVDEDSESLSSWRVSTIPIRRHANDTDSPDLRYKWLGGSYGADGCIYGMPSDATTILKIDPIRNEASTFGNVLSTINKWQGGVLSSIDKCFYAVPANMNCVLRVNTDPTAPPSSYLSIDYVDIPIDGDSSQKNIDDKWQGGFVGKDGKIYAIPENFNHVMVVTPGSIPTAEMMK